MPVKATIDGTLWEFSTAAEAVEFQRAFRAGPAVRPPVSPKKRPAARTTAPHPKSSKRANTIKKSQQPVEAASRRGPALSVGSTQILRAVSSIPASGLMSEEFARAIGSTKPSQIPVRMMVLGKELIANGFKPEEVVMRSRVYMKGRAKSVFKAGPRLEDALRQAPSLFQAG